MGDNEEFHLPVYRGSTLLDDTPTLDPKGGLEPAMRSTTDVAAGLDKAMSELLSERQSENLQLVNDLRQRGIRNFVALPEIIVCGKQSCGKSSVLEAISHVSFPRADKHCTTFPTEITINDPREQGVWICWANPIPRGVETRTLIELESEEKSLENLEGVIEKAKDTMRKQRGQECEVQFYNDVLEIKVARKGWPSFTMVDLPGIFENSHNGGRESDVGLVQNMVKSYMQRSETVILAVVEAIDNAQNQKILSMAKEYDKEGSRTLGIITKADRLDQGSGSEQDWVIHASNGHETYRFDEGWHVVRNRDFKEQVWSFEKRDKEEEDYFNSNNSWADLVKENQTGVSNLRKKLADILEKRIANSLPGIAMSLEDHLRDRQQLLKCLGISRATELGQENYLHGISTEFCRLIEEAVTANYTAKRSFFKLPENKLRTVVREKLDEFAIKMNDYGSAFQVDKTNNGPQEGLKLEYIKPEDYLGKIDQILRENRGLVLEGAFDPMILNTLFQNASVNWRYISVKSIETILVYVNRVLDRAVDAVASDKQTSQKIKAMIIQPGMVKLENTLNAKLDEILYACEELPIFTQDPEYAERLSKHRGLNNDTQNSRYYATNVIDIKAMVDIYYRIALRRFIDNIAILVIERYLMQQLGKLFDREKVDELKHDDPKAFKDLALEERSAVLERSRLEKDIDGLEHAVEQFRKRGIPVFNRAKYSLSIHVQAPVTVAKQEPDEHSDAETAISDSISRTPERGLGPKSRTTSRSTSFLKRHARASSLSQEYEDEEEL